ncbi:Phycobilisome linker polypeptide [[Leptolyngbya] sp. PCC 7376]|uniref:phycobilisome rod-core linker polypeptide n=1 Tax=[Leptolyngbya] sp. PCC 7376 TaxID=111781 RepID=UPI00029EE505|nr:phycobilisome rod-core linker polypeptide [[Leptolyngbya] sp. PCC 7376]AFY39347.1 Phycobilisome linker polypeptide [[Leptolyngbya] sp. PCC 7376]
MGNLNNSATLGLDAFEGSPLELRPNAPESDLQQVVNAVYKQVLGNQHLMETENFASAEALLRNGDITVREFVRSVAQSELYKSLFFYSSSQYRFIELNFKHLLGRAPQSQDEIREHVILYNTEGYDAEIDSYLSSNEYLSNFGENVVPSPRGIKTQTGLSNDSFNRMFSLLRGSATNDSGRDAQLITSIAANTATAIQPLLTGNGANYGNSGKRFRIAYSSSKSSASLAKRSKQERVVSYSQMSQAIKSLTKGGSIVINITELS